MINISVKSKENMIEIRKRRAEGRGCCLRGGDDTYTDACENA